MEHLQYPCNQCGAELHFDPGSASLKCPYCGAENTLPEDETVVEELDYREHLKELAASGDTYDVVTIKCTNCGAETTFDSNITSDTCAFCGTPHVLESASTRRLKPQALLPFKVTRRAAVTLFKDWMGSLWFAPNALKRYARHDEKLAGMYLPHWTYDSDTKTAYRGQRGEHYYTTESYTAVENGKSVRRTRQVRKTRWYSASGRVANTFDDILVVASNSLPRSYMTKLEPWDLDALAPYGDAYLSGFRTESYTVDLDSGFGIAKDRMEPIINDTIRRDIGGDDQRILYKDTHYFNITFKHILLPVWISAYRYHGKVYRFLINARTGKVQGERPWSWVKITMAAALAILLIALIVYFTRG